MNHAKLMVALLISITISSGCRHFERTHCGMLVETTEWLKLSDVQQAETETLVGLLDTTDPTLQNLQANCDALNGVVLSGHDAPSWWVKMNGSNTETNVVGLTTCDPEQYTIEVARPLNDNWRLGSIPHEIVHVVQGCDNNHTGWKEMGISAMLLNIYLQGTDKE